MKEKDTTSSEITGTVNDPARETQWLAAAALEIPELPPRRIPLGRRVARAFSTVVASMFAIGGPAFRCLSVSHAASTAGDALVAIGLANTLFFAVPTSEARNNVVAYLVLTMAPFAVIGPLLGRIFDLPNSERVVLIAASLLRVIVAIGLIFTVLDPDLKWWLFGLSFLLLVMSRVHGIARSALMPQALNNAVALVTANAKLAQVGVVGGGLAVVVGAGLSLIDPRAVLIAAAAAFAVATQQSLALPGTQTPQPPSRGPLASRVPYLTKEPRTGGEWLPGGVEEDPVPETEPRSQSGRRPLDTKLRLARIATTVVRFLNGFLVLLLAFAFRDVDAPLADFGAILAAAGGGFGVAAVAAPFLERRLREEPMVVAALAVVAAAAFVAGQFFGLPAAAALSLAAGYAWGTAKFAFDGLLQATAPPEQRGRAFTASETIFQVAWVVGALVPTAIAVDVRIGLLGGGIAALFAQTLYVSRLLQRL